MRTEKLLECAELQHYHNQYAKGTEIKCLLNNHRYPSKLVALCRAVLQSACALGYDDLQDWLLCLVILEFLTYKPLVGQTLRIRSVPTSFTDSGASTTLNAALLYVISQPLPVLFCGHMFPCLAGDTGIEPVSLFLNEGLASPCCTLQHISHLNTILKHTAHWVKPQKPRRRT